MCSGRRHTQEGRPSRALLPELFHVQASPTEFLLRVLALAGAAAFAVQAQAAEEVSLYTTREPKLIQPLLDAFTRKAASRSTPSSSRTACLSESRPKAPSRRPTC